MNDATTGRAGLVQVKLPPHVKEWLRQQAAAQERSQSWLLTKIVTDACALSVRAAQKEPQQ